jgi:tetratricopeptide (TPR) repeat protein
MLARVLFAIMLCAGAARAAEPLTDDEAGKRHYLSAQAYFDQAAYADALREYQESYRLSRYPAILYQIGQCQERLGQVPEAIATFEKYLEADPQSKRRASVETAVANLKERLKKGEPPRPPTPATPSTPAPQTTPAPSEPARAPSSRRWVAPGVVLGVAGAFAIVGGGLLGTIQPEIDKLAMESPSAPDYLTRIADLESRANAGYALLGIAGAAAVVDIVLWVVAAKRGERPVRTASLRW